MRVDTTSSHRFNKVDIQYIKPLSLQSTPPEAGLRSPHIQSLDPPTLLAANPTGSKITQAKLIKVGCRLSDFWRVWRDKGASPRIVNILRFGLMLNFWSKPPLARTPLIISDYKNTEKKKALRQEVSDLLEKGAVEVVRNVRSLGFYSRVFLFLRKRGVGDRSRISVPSITS